MGINAPNPHTPLPLDPMAAGNPYLGMQGQARPGVPIDPWRESLRLMMFIWGAVLLASFATPLATDPMMFHWNVIADAPGSAKLPSLLIAAVGVLGIMLAAIPMVSLPRGILAAVLGLAGIMVPIFLKGMPDWRMLIAIVGMIALVPGLLVRNEYTDSLFARVLVTIGVVCALLPLLIPTGG